MNMNKNRNETEPPPADDNFDFEDFGPDDLELIRSATPVDEDDDYEEWEDDPWEELRREEQRQWLRDLADPDDPSVRVVELGRFFAAVFDDFEGGTLTLAKLDERESMTYFDPRPYGDERLREKIKGYLLFM